MGNLRIIHNAKIFTANSRQPWAEGAVIKNGKFEFVGSSAEALEYAETHAFAGDPAHAETHAFAGDPAHAESYAFAEASAFTGSHAFAKDALEILDAHGKVIIPGLIDAHTHMGLSVIMGEDDETMPIWDSKSKDEILQNLRDYVRKHPFRLYYIAFFGQVEALGKEGLNKRELDEIVKRRPVILMEQECHSAWLNSGAMKYLKIREDVKDMAAGYSYYERDEKGRLTGCIKEMTMLPILELAGGISSKKMEAGILKIANYLLAHGVTTVFDAGNYIDEEKTYKLLADMDKSGRLPVRIEATYIINTPEKADIAVDEFKRYKSLYETEHIKFKTIKIMFDGTHRIHTAKLCSPYNDVDTLGGTMLTEDKLYELMSRLNQEGIDFHAHTVGEGASKMILDCGQRIVREQGGLNIKVTLAHLETQRDEDIPRFRELGITGNFTPHWHGGNDYGTMEATEYLLGEKRANNLFRAKSMIDAGANVTFSSDEVTLQLLDRWNPFLGIEIGHTRREVNDGGRTVPVFPPDNERLSIEELIRGYTINAAKALRLDGEIGSIEVGKSADYMILKEDIFEMNPYDIHNILPEEVVVGGKTVSGSNIAFGRENVSEI